MTRAVMSSGKVPLSGARTTGRSGMDTLKLVGTIAGAVLGLVAVIGLTAATVEYVSTQVHEVKSVRENVATLAAGQARLESAVLTITDDVAAMKGTIAALQAGQAKILELLEAEAEPARAQAGPRPDVPPSMPGCVLRSTHRHRCGCAAASGGPRWTGTPASPPGTATARRLRARRHRRRVVKWFGLPTRPRWCPHRPRHSRAGVPRHTMSLPVRGAAGARRTASVADTRWALGPIRRLPGMGILVRREAYAESDFQEAT